MEAEPTSSQTERAHTPGGWVAWRSISRWYWGAISVIAVAALAQFFRAAPVTTPGTAVSATLAPGVTLQIAYPREVRPVLRPADESPLALTLQGAGTVTYTVALSASTPLLFTDSQQQVVNPRAELAVNGCCQSSVIFYPQASSKAWHWQPVEINAYVTASGAPPPGAPTLTFTLYLEPVWSTWGRRLLLLFAELGLAVSVALALGGWAIERQNRQQEQTNREYDRRQELYLRWEARLESARKLCVENLLTGMGQLLDIEEEIQKTPERDWKLDRWLQQVKDAQAIIKAEFVRPDSNQIEQCLEQITRRLESKQSLAANELDAIEHLFNDEFSTSDRDSGSLKAHLEALGKERDSDTTLKAASYLYNRFEYSPAVRNLVVTLIKEWYDSECEKNSADIKGVSLGEFRYLLHDPRLFHIPSKIRTDLYRWPDLGSYLYPWANGSETNKLRAMLWKTSISVGGNHDDPRLVKIDYEYPHILQYPEAIDADCGSFLIYAQLHRESQAALQNEDRPKSPGRHSSSFAPFPAFVDLGKASKFPTSAVQLFCLHSYVRAVSDSWIRLLACNLDLWSGLQKSQKEMLAGLLMFTSASESTLRYRLLEYFLNEQCRKRDLGATLSEFGVLHRAEDEIRISKLSNDIEKNYRSANLPNKPDEDVLTMWLSVRPPFLTHTVIIALAKHDLGLQFGANSLDDVDSLSRHLLRHRVIVHLAIAKLSDISQSWLSTRYNLLDCRCSNTQLNDVAKAVLGDDLSSVIAQILSEGDADKQEQAVEKILEASQGSPGRLCHNLYQIYIAASDNPEQRLTFEVIEKILRTNSTSG
ncbi:MAG TPA: hypothetical protein GX400_22515 [Chloroflexi bacterium]|nr:hypothetical protein [Chloroflexota bacterium]